ncbi:MAG: tail fiber domain-containing protein, partial [Candidatus Shapirobacteria bacterium]|nr:tail fiber domain-containing protein [Candidatus Shapirobacteria bacterium]
GFMRSTAIGTIPTAGKGTEVFYHTSQDLGYVLAYDRSASAYRPLRIEGSSVQINSGSGGSVGIGTASPQTTLHAAGNVMADNIFYFGYNTGGGSALCYSASGTYSGYNFVRPCTSLAELKDNVQDLNLGLETIMQLTPRTFNWKEDGSADLGFIAEEIEAVNPLLAVYTRGELIGVKYQNLTALLAKGMQEQQKQIETTSQKVALLDNDLSITRSGDLSVELLQEDYQVRNISTGQIVKRVGALGEAVFGKARVGLIETIDIVADAVNARQIKSDRLLSPIIETEEVRLTNQDSKIKTANQNSKLSIVNSANQPTAEFNTETKTTTLFGDLTVAGNIGVGRSINAGQLSAQGATFGDLLAQNVGIGKLEAEEISTQKLDVAQDATIAGTLYVDRIIARDGGFGELLAKNISIDSIKSIIREEIALSQEEATGPDKPLQEQEEELNIDQLLAEVESWLNLNTGSDLPIDGQTSLVENQITTLADHSVYQGSLTVLGQTTLSHVFIGDQLTVGSLVLANNSLNNPNGTLYLQKEGLGGLDVLNGKFMIDNEGNIFIAQHLTVGGDLVAGNIRPHEGENLTFDLANSIGQGNETPDQAQDDEEQLIQSEEKGFGKLLVRGINQETVVQIDASGSAKFAGTISTDSLSISKQEGDNENLVIAASENLENINIWAPGITTNASAGEAVLPVGQTDLIVYNDRLTEESMIYLTPTSDTKNQVLYIKAKVAKTTTEAEDQSQTEISYFVVGINQPINEEVRFNWWIIGNN